MHNQIASYLFQHKTCPLPGLGTLSVKYAAAEYDFTNKSITAPKTYIEFSSTSSDTTGLLHYLAATSGSSAGDVSGALDDFCSDLKKEMTGQQAAQLKNVGSFFVDASGNINFKPEELPVVFAQPVFADRVVHPDAEHAILVGDKETTNTFMAELLTPKTETRDRWWIWAIILGAVGLIALLIYFTELKGTLPFGNTIKI
jgi:hypothetical protein